MFSSLYRKPWIRFVAPEGVEDGGGSQEETTTDDRLDDLGEPAEESDSEDSNSDDEDSSVWDSERAMAKIKKINAENKRLRDRAKTAETQAEKSAKDLTSENESLKERLLRLEVANELGLPATIAGRLQGKSRDEIVADAEELLKLIGPKRPGTQKPGNPFGEGHGTESGQGAIDYEDMVSSVINP